MKHVAFLTAVLSVALIAGECFAQPPREGQGQRREGQPGQAQRGQQDRQGQRGRGPRDPKAMVARFMEFDKDGDKKLDEQELMAAFAAMNQQRGEASPRGEGQGRPREGRPGEGRRGEGRPGEGRRRPAEGEGGDGNRPRRPENNEQN